MNLRSGDNKESQEREDGSAETKKGEKLEKQKKTPLSETPETFVTFCSGSCQKKKGVEGGKKAGGEKGMEKMLTVRVRKKKKGGR